MAVGRISGPNLEPNLVREGVDLAFETDLVYLDVTSGRVGFNTDTPSRDVEVSGILKSTEFQTDKITIEDVLIEDSVIKRTSPGDLEIKGSSVADNVSIPRVSIPYVDSNVNITQNLTVDLESTLEGAVTVNAVATFTDTTNSSSLTTGSVVVEGGAAVAKTQYLGENLVGSGVDTSSIDDFNIDGGTF